MIEVAYAMAPAGEQAQGGGMALLFPLALIFLVFYFLVFRPQNKQIKERQEMLNKLEKGVEVVTNGGIVGTITGLNDKVVTLEIAQKVRIKVLRSYIAGPMKTVMPQESPETDGKK